MVHETQYPMMLLKETTKLSTEQEILLILHQMQWLRDQAEERGAAWVEQYKYCIRFRPTPDEEKTLEQLYQRMIEMLDLFGWKSPEWTLEHYVNYGYMPLLPKGELQWTTIQIL